MGDSCHHRFYCSALVVAVNQVIQFILWILPTIFLHELGHYVAYRLFGIKPKIKFHWWGLSIGEIKDYFVLAPYKVYFIGASGIVAGMIYTSVFNDILYNLLYILISMIDFILLYHTMLASYKKYTTMGDFYIYNVKEQWKELMQAQNAIRNNKP